MVKEIKKIEEHKVKIELLSDDELTIKKAEPAKMSTTDSKFLADAQHTKTGTVK